jgi:hypothetical protein
VRRDPWQFRALARLPERLLHRQQRAASVHDDVVALPHLLSGAQLGAAAGR